MEKFVYFKFQVSAATQLTSEMVKKIKSAPKGYVSIRDEETGYSTVRIHADQIAVVQQILEKDSGEPGHMITLMYGVAQQMQFYATAKTFRTALELTLENAYEIALGKKHQEMNEACFTLTRCMKQKREHQLEQYALDKLDPPASYNDDDIYRLKRRHVDKIETLDFNSMCAQQIIDDAQKYITRLNRLYGRD